MPHNINQVGKAGRGIHDSSYDYPLKKVLKGLITVKINLTFKGEGIRKLP